MIVIWKVRQVFKFKKKTIWHHKYTFKCFFQAASTPTNPLTFQCEFVKLRIDMLQAFSQLICTCNSLKTSPPPAIATAIAMASGNDLQRCGRITNQVCICLPYVLDQDYIRDGPDGLEVSRRRLKLYPKSKAGVGNSWIISEPLTYGLTYSLLLLSLLSVYVYYFHISLNVENKSKMLDTLNRLNLIYGGKNWVNISASVLHQNFDLKCWLLMNISSFCLWFPAL